MTNCQTPSAPDIAGMQRRQTHTAGVLLVLISSLVFSTAGVFTKSVDADAWSVIFWRGISATLLSLLYVSLCGKLGDEWRRFRWPAVAVTILGASGTAAFIPAFKLTSVANVALIWATAPFAAALLAWVAIGERPTRRIVSASLMALLGVSIAVQGSSGPGSLTGDALAVWMTLMMAGVIVIYRVWPETPTVLPTAFSSIVLLPPALIFSAPMATSQTEIWVLIAFGLIFAVASITLFEGARRIPAAQTALLGALETPLAPVWALLILSEFPTSHAIIGGAIVMTAVILSQVRPRHSET